MKIHYLWAAVIVSSLTVFVFFSLFLLIVFSLWCEYHHSQWTVNNNIDTIIIANFSSRFSTVCKRKMFQSINTVADVMQIKVFSIFQSVHEVLWLYLLVSKKIERTGRKKKRKILLHSWFKVGAHTTERKPQKNCLPLTRWWMINVSWVFSGRSYNLRKLCDMKNTTHFQINIERHHYTKLNNDKIFPVPCVCLFSTCITLNCFSPHCCNVEAQHSTAKQRNGRENKAK